MGLGESYLLRGTRISMGAATTAMIGICGVFATVVGFESQEVPPVSVIIPQAAILDDVRKQELKLPFEGGPLFERRGRLEPGGIDDKGHAKPDPVADFFVVAGGGMLAELESGLAAGEKVLEVELVISIFVGIHDLAEFL